MNKDAITDVFFDLDHTLWDFDRNSALTFEKIFGLHDMDISIQDFLGFYEPTNLEYWKLYREEKISKEVLRYQRLKVTFDKLSHQVADELIYKLSEDYINHLTTFNYLFKDCIDILDYLKPKYRLHIITNGFEEVQEKKLSRSGIGHYFDWVINSEMAGVKKPNPHIFHLALEKARVSAQQSVMIGDSLEADILGAKKVGMHALHYNINKEENHNVCAIINTLSEIKSLL